MRLVAPDGSGIEPESRALVAEVCGHEDWDALLAAHDEARQSIAELWAQRKRRDDMIGEGDRRRR